MTFWDQNHCFITHCTTAFSWTKQYLERLYAAEVLVGLSRLPGTLPRSEITDGSWENGKQLQARYGLWIYITHVRLDSLGRKSKVSYYAIVHLQLAKGSPPLRPVSSKALRLGG